MLAGSCFNKLLGRIAPPLGAARFGDLQVIDTDAARLLLQDNLPALLPALLDPATLILTRTSSLPGLGADSLALNIWLRQTILQSKPLLNQARSTAVPVGIEEANEARIFR